MMSYEILEGMPGEVVEHVVFDLGNREVALAQVQGAFGMPGTTWVARSDNGLRHNPDPRIALERHVSSERAERLVGAYEAFKGLENSQSEES